MLLSNLNLLAEAPGGVARLRELILTLAVQGKLVPQDAKDEPASEFLKKIRVEKDRLIAGGKIKRDKPLAEIDDSEKPFGLPKGWEWVRLANAVLKITDGEHLSPPKADEGMPLLTAKDVTSRGVQFEGTQYVSCENGLKYRQRCDPARGDVLICSRGTIGRCAAVETDETFCLMGSVILLKVSEQSSYRYLLAYLTTGLAQTWMRGVTSATAVSALYLKDVARCLIPVPPLTEQSRIVTRVEELMRLCDALEAKGQLEATQHAQLVTTLLATLTDSETPAQLTENWQRIATHFDLLLDRPEAVNALEQTILQLAVRGLLVAQDPQDEPASELIKKIRAEKDKLIADGKIKRDKPLPPIAEDEQPFALPVGWEWVRLGEIVLISSGVTLGRKTAIDSPVLLPYLRVANVQRWHLNLASMKELVIDTSELERFQLVKGDLLITEGGDWDKVGRTAIWRDELPTCVHQNHVFKVRGTSGQWNPVWAEMYLNSAIARAYFASSAKQTTNLASINMTQLKDCAFPVPPLAEQSRIVTRVAQLRRLCTDLRQRLTASQSTQAHLAEALVENVA